MIKISRLVANKYSQEYLLEAFSFVNKISNNRVFGLDSVGVSVAMEDEYELIFKLECALVSSV